MAAEKNLEHQAGTTPTRNYLRKVRLNLNRKIRNLFSQWSTKAACENIMNVTLNLVKVNIKETNILSFDLWNLTLNTIFSECICFLLLLLWNNPVNVSLINVKLVNTTSKAVNVTHITLCPRKFTLKCF